MSRNARHLAGLFIAVGALAGVSPGGEQPRAALLPVPYYCQEDTEWCFFNSAAMILQYYRPEMANPANAKKPWEIAADYGKARNESLGGKDAILADLGLYINRMEPGLKAKGSAELLPLGGMRAFVEGKVREGKPVLVGRGGALAHAVVCVGVGAGGLWINNPGQRPQLPFPDANSGLHTFLTWEEFDKLFVAGTAPRYSLYCDRRPARTGQAAIGLGNSTISFHRRSSLARIAELAWDGRHPGGYYWLPPAGGNAVVPQKDAALDIVQFAVGNPSFDQRRDYLVRLDLRCDGGTRKLADTAVRPLAPGQFVRQVLAAAPIDLPETHGGQEALCLVLRDSAGNEIDRCEFEYTRAPAAPEGQKGMLDVVFCIDKSGSMINDIKMIQSAASRVIDSLASYAASGNVSLQIGLVLYSRHTDKNWIEHSLMTPDADQMRRDILSVSITDIGLGAGGNEDLYAAMMYAMNRTVGGRCLVTKDRPRGMGWRQGAAKIILAVGDEPPDEPDWEARTLDDVAQCCRDLDPVHIYPLILPKQGPAILDSTVRSMDRVAAATGGQTVRVQDAGSLPKALVDTVRLAIRRHREEVWRKENPPYALYAMMAGVVALAFLALVVAMIVQFRKRPRPAAEPASSSARRGAVDPTLTGEATARRGKRL